MTYWVLFNRWGIGLRTINLSFRVPHVWRHTNTELPPETTLEPDVEAFERRAAERTRVTNVVRQHT